MAATRHRIALLYNATLAYDVKVMSGVAAYLQQDARHSVFLEDGAPNRSSLAALRSWNVDGIIADLNDPAISRTVRTLRRPVVGFGAAWRTDASDIPFFYANNDLIARLAADHLLDRGFRHLTYCGYRGPSDAWSQERERALRACVAQRGLTVSAFHVPHRTTRPATAVERRLAAWLRGLPKPVGVVAANDALGRRVLEACRTAGLCIPDEVAVIGVDNDELVCGLANPPLSSVEQGARRLGYSAAALLDRMLAGERFSGHRFVIDPLAVVVRQSSDILAVTDPDVAHAVAFIHDQAATGVDVRAVVRRSPLSRAALDHKFRTLVHCTITTFIRRARLERVRQLVAGTARPLKQIASDSGFTSVQHMTTVFTRTFGHSPARYRRVLVAAHPRGTRRTARFRPHEDL